MSQNIGQKARNLVARLLGIPFPAVDPLHFLVDEEIRPFRLDHRHDLTGTGRQACATVSTGIFIVHEHTVPANTCEVIHGYFGHCWQRLNGGSAEESVQIISPERINGFAIFTPSKNTNDFGITIERNYNKNTVQATPNDTDRDNVSGDTFVSADAAMLANMQMRSPLTTIMLPANSKFRVLFQLAPGASTKTLPVGAEETPIPNPFTIGENPVNGPDFNTRVDFAGALVYGVRMPQTLYNTLRKARAAGLLGPEAGRLIDGV